MNIAVVIQDVTLHQAMKEYCERFQFAYDHDFSVEFYASCEAIYRNMQAGATYDLLFLEIEMAAMCGIELGKRIRNELRNHTVQLVFISSTTEYAVRLFPLRPLDYLVKPVAFERFCACLNVFLNDSAAGNSFMTYTLENTQRKIRVSELLYLKTYGKKVEMHARDACFSVYGKISELISGCETQFLCVSRGEYANIQHIIAATPREVRLTGDHVLHISRGRQQAVFTRLAQF